MNGTHTQLFRFLLAGGLNTAATYVLYWVLLRVFDYRLAYTAAFLAGIVIAYVLNTRFVFRVEHSVRKAASFPLVYLVQYSVGYVVLWLWSDVLHLPKQWGILAVTAATIPLTFVLSRALLKPETKAN